MSKVDLRGGIHSPNNSTSKATSDVRILVAELVRRRCAAGMTQQDLADRIGTSQRTISKLENLAHEPRVNTLLAWARALGVRIVWDLEDLFDHADSTG